MVVMIPLIIISAVLIAYLYYVIKKPKKEPNPVVDKNTQPFPAELLPIEFSKTISEIYSENGYYEDSDKNVKEMINSDYEDYGDVNDYIDKSKSKKVFEEYEDYSDLNKKKPDGDESNFY